MEATKNLCAQIPESLHARVRTEQEQSGQTLSQYVTALITKWLRPYGFALRVQTGTVS